MNMTGIIATEEARQGFYPTPPEVAEKLLADVEWHKISTILEPSAGKGDLIRAAVRSSTADWPKSWGRYDRTAFEVDAVEIDPYLRSILQYEFGGQKKNELAIRMQEIDRYRSYDSKLHDHCHPSPETEMEFRAMQKEHQILKAVDLHIAHDNFLTMDTRKTYDLILMNPPFANGDEHLLKAIDMQRRSGGEIRCILNAETILNPYTNRRKILQNHLSSLNADIQFVENGFSHAERETDASVALIKISIPAVEHESSIFNHLREAAKMDEPEPEEVTDMTVTDFLQEIVARFNVEVDAGLALIREYIALKKHIGGTISLSIGDRSKYSTLSQNGFVELMREKYWEMLFNNSQFTAKLTSNLKDKYRGMVGKMGAYDFSLFNIQQIMIEMNAEMAKGVQDTIVALFDKMTTQHTYYPECIKNIHYFDGWKTNKAHKINGKVILPVYGLMADSSWSRDTIKVRQAEETIGDIEKVFDYLDGNLTSEVDLHGVLERANEEKQTKNIPCKYFDVTLYKKGTMHIRFRNMELVERFNIYCSQKKGWLPPNYGRTNYSDMSREEKSVVDGFHGTGAEGSGEKAYREVMTNRAYYLAEPTRQMPLLTAGE